MTPTEAQDQTVALVLRLAAYAGPMPSPFSMNGRATRSLLVKGYELKAIERHYKKLIDAFGGDIFRQAHGEHEMFSAKEIREGTLAARLADGSYTRELIKRIRAAGREVPQ